MTLIEKALIALAAIMMLALMSMAVMAHQSVTGWTYPPECCSNGDCAEALKVEYLADNSMSITTRHGVAIYPHDFPRRVSPDQHIHACHIGGTKYCLFVPAGT